MFENSAKSNENNKSISFGNCSEDLNFINKETNNENISNNNNSTNNMFSKLLDNSNLA